MIHRNKILLIGFFLLFLLNVLLLFYYQMVINKFFWVSIKNRVPFLQKELIIKNLEFSQLSNNNLMITKGDADRLIFNKASFNAIIDGPLVFNEKTNLYSLPLRVDFFKQRVINLILGEENGLFYIKKAKNGIVSNNLSKNIIKTIDSGKYFKKNYPIIATIIYDYNHYDIYAKDSRCKKTCKDSLIKYKEYTKNADFLFNNRNVNNNLDIGPVTEIVVFEL